MGPYYPHKLFSFACHPRNSLITSFGLFLLTLTGLLLQPVRTLAAPSCVFYVDASVLGGTGNGNSWMNAMKAIQPAINAAEITTLSACPGGAEVWVAAGTYRPGLTRTDTFLLKNKVAVYGGFAGTEITREARNWMDNLTTLSGEITASLLTDNIQHIVTATNVDRTAVLDGFMITAGYSDGDGGGIYAQGASPALANLVITANTAAGLGGGMAASGGAPTLTNVTFNANHANGGGGMINLNGAAAVLDHVTFAGNVTNASASQGGGLYNVSAGIVTLVDTTFSNNTAAYGGGMANWLGSSPNLTRVTFTANSAREHGGGMFNHNNSPVLTDVIFERNSATYWGGGMENNTEQSSPSLSRVTFLNNTAQIGGGMYNYMANHPTLNNVTLMGNVASSAGGGIYDWFATPTLTDVVFSGNQSGDCGGGFANFDASPVLIRVTFTRNTAMYCGGGMSSSGAGQPVLTDVLFEGNQTAKDGLGGGMFLNNNSNPILTRVVFRANQAKLYGGGLYSRSSTPVLVEGSFEENTATTGGGMYNEYSNPSLRGLIFNGNMASSDGGALFNKSSSPTLLDVTFTNNSGTQGGALENYDYSSPALVRVTFTGNQATLFNGGAVHNTYGSKPVFTNVTFRNNTAAWCGGGMNSDLGAQPTLSNIVFYGNSAESGGGLCAIGDGPEIRQATFYSNHAASRGGAIFNSGGSPQVFNSILWGNTSAGVGPQVYNTDNWAMTLYHTLIQGCAGTSVDSIPECGLSPEPEHLLYVDPLFADPINGDLRLLPYSPAIDAGDPGWLPRDTADLDADGVILETLPFDLDGNPRVASAGPDLGAYEQPIPNHMPQLTGPLSLPGLFEDPLNNSGARVSSLLSGHVTDADGTAGSAGLAITAADDHYGVWQVSLDGATWVPLAGSPANTSAVLVSPDSWLRFVPQANWNGSAALTVRAWDGSDGHVPGSTGVDVSVNGRAAPYSAETSELSVTVAPIDDAPACKDITHSTKDNETITFSPACSDIDSPNLTYEIVTPAKHGQAGVNAGQLVYDPEDYYSGTDTFTYRASDGELFSQSVLVNLSVTRAILCYPLTLSHTGQGSTPVASPTNSEGCPTGQYVAGATIVLSEAAPETGWQISGWTGTSNNSSMASSNILTMPTKAESVSVVYLIITDNTIDEFIWIPMVVK